MSSIHHGGVRVHSSIHDSSVTSHSEPQRISDARRQRRVRVGDNKEHQATCGTFSTYTTPGYRSHVVRANSCYIKINPS